jgi:hypothetical protein
MKILRTSGIDKIDLYIRLSGGKLFFSAKKFAGILSAKYSFGCTHQNFAPFKITFKSQPAIESRQLSSDVDQKYYECNRHSF